MVESKRNVWAVMSGTLADSAASAIVRATAPDIANGFSISSGLLARIASPQITEVNDGGVTTTTAST
jgi:hypothetical protein